MVKSTVRGFTALLLVGVLLGAVYGLNVLARPAYDPNLNVAFIGTRGDSDCAVVWQSDFAMMIDTGGAGDAAAILDFLKKQGIRELNYLILTHPDENHMGSAVEISRAIKIRTAIEPYYQKPNDGLAVVNTRLAQQQAKSVFPSRVLRYSFGDIQILVYPPLEKHYDEDNNYSLGVLIKHGGTNIFFTGDAEEKRTNEMLALELPQAALLKLPHHGRYHAAAEDILTGLHPVYGVVTSFEADSRIRGVCEALGTELFYTAGKNVLFLSDGKELRSVGG